MKRFAHTSTALALLALASVFAPSAQAAGSAADNFVVDITLSPACVLSTPPTLAMGYTAFATSASTGSTNFVVRCSTSLAYAVALDAATLTDGTTGLNYTLALKTANTGDASTAVASLAAQVGAAAGKTYYVQGYIGTGQAGTTTAGVPNNTRTVTVSY